MKNSSPATATPRTGRRWARRAALIGAPISAVGLVLATPFSALALTSSPAPTAGVYTDGTSVTITSTGVSSANTYDVSVCTVAGYAPTGAPACTDAFAYTISGTTLTSTVLVEKGASNAHFGVIPGQPTTVDCTAASSCYIAVAVHTATSGTVVDFSSPFQVV
jgi:hypothetical protein